jgi:hypothetical protein
MTRPLKPVKEFYTETEAAGYLNISIGELHALLDQHIFNDGNPRPEDITFCEADLALLGFWSRSQVPTVDSESPKVIPMPRRHEP